MLLVAGAFSSLTSSSSSAAQSTSPHNQISRSSACGLHRTARTKPNSFRLMQMREAARIWPHLSQVCRAIGFEHLAVVLHNNATDEAKQHFFVVKARGESCPGCPVRIDSNGSETPLMTFDFQKAVKEQECVVGINKHSVVAVASI